MKIPTDEQLNLAMCVWMGWTNGKNGLGDSIWLNPNRSAWFTQNDLPNYLFDDSPRYLLNGAEAKLNNDQYDCYINSLVGLCIKHQFERINSAPARYRVIAILQTVKPELFT